MGDYIAIYAELADKIIVKPFAYADLSVNTPA